MDESVSNGRGCREENIGGDASPVRGSVLSFRGVIVGEKAPSPRSAGPYCRFYMRGGRISGRGLVDEAHTDLVDALGRSIASLGPCHLPIRPVAPGLTFINSLVAALPP